MTWTTKVLADQGEGGPAAVLALVIGQEPRAEHANALQIQVEASTEAAAAAAVGRSRPVCENKRSSAGPSCPAEVTAAEPLPGRAEREKLSWWGGGKELNHYCSTSHW